MGIPDECSWRELCEAALLELDPTRLVQRIAVARSAILQRSAAKRYRGFESVTLRHAVWVTEKLPRLLPRNTEQCPYFAIFRP
jgi:hypothetical protein